MAGHLPKWEPYPGRPWPWALFRGDRTSQRTFADDLGAALDARRLSCFKDFNILSTYCQHTGSHLNHPKPSSLTWPGEEVARSPRLAQLGTRVYDSQEGNHLPEPLFGVQGFKLVL